jgi:uracil-DNA glycosylase
MRWTERQRAMLREMGIALWWPAAPVAGDLGRDDARAASPAIGTASRPSSPGTEPSRRDEPAPAGERSPARADESAPPLPRLPGLAPADWLVVAEPLDEADPQQQQLLDNMLRAIGVGLIAPSRERRAVFCALASDADPARHGAIDPALEAAVTATNPRCILAFGRAGAAALLGADAPLGGLRGRIHAFGGVPVVVTFSLAFLLRHPAEKAKAWADLCLAVGGLAAAA